MGQSSPEGIILGKGSKLESLDLSINQEKVLAIKQQERSYSEEDMLEFGEWMKVLPLTISGFVVKTKTKSIVVEKTKDLLQIWFEQFKKK